MEKFSHSKQVISEFCKIAKKALGAWDLEVFSENDNYHGVTFSVDCSSSYEKTVYEGVGVREVECVPVERKLILQVAKHKISGKIVSKTFFA